MGSKTYMFRVFAAVTLCIAVLLALLRKQEHTGIDIENAWKLLISTVVHPSDPGPISESERILSLGEISQLNGQDESTPIYLALLGRVFDVSKGRQYYGPGEGYHIFAGKDASRAFVTGDFTPTGLIDDVLDLDDQDFGGLAEWLRFYHNDYTYIGKLSGRYFDGKGKLTEYGEKVEEKIKRAALAKEAQEAEAQVYPPCNSEWSQANGGRVWCSKSSGAIERDWEGVPRIYRPPGANAPRCVCVRSSGSPTSNSLPGTDEGDVRDPHLKEYPNCSPTAVSCRIS